MLLRGLREPRPLVRGTRVPGTRFGGVRRAHSISKSKMKDEHGSARLLLLKAVQRLSEYESSQCQVILVPGSMVPLVLARTQHFQLLLPLARGLSYSRL